MKNALYALVAALLVTALSGCVILPYDDYGYRGGHHHYYRGYR
jgi:hypothetical protein